jgi:pantoate--beta-alanine ligase
MQPEQRTTIAETRKAVADARRRGLAIGLVPTMGALHAGHAALIERARHDAGYVVVSIFVNPIQFDRPEDYQAYRIDLQRDLNVCAEHGADLVFAPPVEEVYPSPQSTFVEVLGLTDHLCGHFRPGHFRGVTTVVSKLFHMVAPDLAFFGEKDAQQLAVIERMVLDLNLPIRIVPVPTVRDSDGLAVSSRNARLSPEERRIAPLLFQALTAARESVVQGCSSTAEVRRKALALFESRPQFRVEYLEIVDPKTMIPVAQITGPVRIAAAVWLGNTRLIDNVYCPRTR